MFTHPILIMNELYIGGKELKKKILLMIAIGLLLLVVFPFLSWELSSEKNLNVSIIDNTVSDETYREHKGITWALNYFKYTKDGKDKYDIKDDYIGFVPLKDKDYKIREIEDDIFENSDLIYMADTYGVYEDEFYDKSVEGNRSELIYGGLSIEDLDIIKNNLYENQIPFVGEFNSFGSPTNEETSKELTDFLGIEWSGWIGRYFREIDPSENGEVTSWMVNNYENQYNEKWDFEGEGFILVSENDEVLVLEGEKDVESKGISFKFTKEGKQFFDTDKSSIYDYWFDISSAEEADILANYEWNLTGEGKEKLKEYNIPFTFPAVTKSTYYGVPIYYFAGDYADINKTPVLYKYKGLTNIISKISDFQKKQGNNFYWRTYIPMMESILEEAKEIKDNKEIKKAEYFNENNINYKSRINKKGFQLYDDNKWKDNVITGINMGMAKPGKWPGEASITFEEYYRWMKQIGEMGVNTIRVYTVHPPEFYKALWVYNQQTDKPLYVIHGSWIEEETLIDTQDAFSDENVENFEEEMKKIVDIIHGDITIEEEVGHASGKYQYDVSPYIIGWIIGIEWDPNMVNNTNNTYENILDYDGKYFNTENATAFENWIAQRMDYIISYEMDNYNWQRPISFTNWPTTDLLEHPSEPLENEDLVSINPNNIHKTEELKSGYFASYHVYPYYPDFINYEKKYLEFVDHRGEKNNYAGYLNDLIDSHDMPVLIAEFGVPSSRGKTHENAFGWDQGEHSEKDQGHIVIGLFEDILEQVAVGGLLFTWQDEWFKRTWNTMELDNPDRRPYWSNVQTNEQRFGVLKFESDKMIIDGSKDKWKDNEPLYSNKDKGNYLKNIYMDKDEAYMYFRIEYHDNFVEDADTFILIDSILNQGNKDIPLLNLSSEKGIDFIIKISHDKNDSRVIVDKYYDPFYYQYGYELKYLSEHDRMNKNSGEFNPIRLALSKPVTIPSTGEKIPFDYYETGELLEGNGNPENKDYNSLSDYYIDSDENVIEVRIPWLLLNFKDPSQKEVMGDLWENGLDSSKTISEISIGAVITKNSKTIDSFPLIKDNLIKEKDFKSFSWENWIESNSKEGFKKSYYLLKDYLNKNFEN